MSSNIKEAMCETLTGVYSSRAVGSELSSNNTPKHLLLFDRWTFRERKDVLCIQDKNVRITTDDVIKMSFTSTCPADTSGVKRDISWCCSRRLQSSTRFCPLFLKKLWIIENDCANISIFKQQWQITELGSCCCHLLTSRLLLCCPPSRHSVPSQIHLNLPLREFWSLKINLMNLKARRYFSFQPHNRAED